MVDKRMFGVFLSHSQYQSKIQFGGYDNYYIKQGEAAKGYGVHWYKLLDSSYWQVSLFDAQYGGSSFQS
jgi:hypothetical protein